jgi:pimeloyl-ACP methyl ester carboxylesterase
VIGEAARDLAGVGALVFVAAYILDEGESIATVLDPQRFSGGLLGPDTTLERPFDDGDDLYITTEHFAKVFAADLPEEQTRLMSYEQRPLSLSALTGVAAARPAWHDKPSWALIAEHDNAIPPDGQRWMAQRAAATLGSVASSHAVMLSQPAAVTETILEAARSVTADT